MSGQSCGNSAASTKSSRRFRRRGLLPARRKWRHYLPVCRASICHGLLSRNAAKVVFFFHEGRPACSAGRPFCVHQPFCFFLGSTAQMSCAELNAFFVSCKQQMAEKTSPTPPANCAALPYPKLGENCQMLPGRMPAAQAFPAGAAWMKPWDGAGHQVLSPPKSRVRSFTQRYLR